MQVEMTVENVRYIRWLLNREAELWFERASRTELDTISSGSKDGLLGEACKNLDQRTIEHLQGMGEFFTELAVPFEEALQQLEGEEA